MTLSLLDMARMTAWISYRTGEGTPLKEVTESLPSIFPDTPSADLAEFLRVMAQAHFELAGFLETLGAAVRPLITVIDGGKK